MSAIFNFDWSRDETIDGVSYPKDTLDRAKYAAFLANFLRAKGHDESTGESRNYVLNLNSGWGSGKTYFVKRWAFDLKKSHPVVYIDAWQQDYSDDPLMTVISSVIKQLRVQAGKAEDDPAFKAPRKLIGLLKAAAPAVASSVAKRYLGFDPVALMSADESDLLEGKVKDDEGKELDMGSAASAIVNNLIAEHNAKADAIEGLKKAIEEWVIAAKSQSEPRTSLPAFVFIDELDRCRPSYAVEMLETIKHIFDIPGIVFVIATDTHQLQHAIKAVYGAGFDANVYLSRFFHSRYSLKKMPFSELLDTHCDMHKLSLAYLRDRKIQVWPSWEDEVVGQDNLSQIFRAFEMQPREVIQVTERLVSIIDNLAEGQSVSLYYLLILLCLKDRYFEIYSSLCRVNFGSVHSQYMGSEREKFDKAIHWDTTSVSIWLDIETAKPLFKNGEGAMSNRYITGSYSITLSELFVCLHIMHNAKSHFDGHLNKATQDCVQILRDAHRAPNYDWSSRSISERNKLLFICGEHFAKVNNNDFGFYENLVELSTSFDDEVNRH